MVGISHVGVVDEPVKRGGDDLLGIELHSRSITKFIERTLTPITIGIQGEWGSGKTSLINSVFHHFSEVPTVKQVWVNAWEFSLLSSPEESLLKIINEILSNLVGDIKDEKAQKIREGASKLFSGALRVAAAATLGASAANVAGDILNPKEKVVTVADLRAQLEEVIEDLRAQRKYNKYIIYIDDLDRIEPSAAVAILELLKNIFSLKNCVFILAIDYQVVVKGLVKKFGKQTSENEWEFRAFFDKLIQLPFSMPLGQYDIGHYVNNLLIEIGYAQDGELDKDAIKQIVQLTIGGNPRSIKRLANSVSLIQIFSETKLELSNPVDSDIGLSSSVSKTVLFALVCIQIAFPHIYTLLVAQPDFFSWDDDFAFSITGGEEERMETFNQDLEMLQKTEYADDVWEQALFKVCYLRPRLKPRFKDIRNLFEIVGKYLSESLPNTSFGMLLSKILEQTSVTTIVSDTNPTVAPQDTEGWESNDTVDEKIAVMLARRDSLSSGSIEIYRNFLRQIESAVHDWPDIFQVRLRKAVTLYSRKKTRGEDQLLYVKEPNNSGAFDVWIRNSSSIDAITEKVISQYPLLDAKGLLIEEGRVKGALRLQPSVSKKIGRKEYEALMLMVVNEVISAEMRDMQ